MTGVIISRSRKNINDVYYPEAVGELSRRLELLSPVTSVEELPLRENELSKTDFIFSTWGMLPLSEAEIKRYFPNVKAVFYSAGTVRYFARPFLDAGIRVFSAWRANGVPVAEVAASQIILANKGFFRRRVRSVSEWNNNDPELAYPGNYKTKVGILGAGAIGSKVIELLSAHELCVYVFDPFLPDKRAGELGVIKSDLVGVFKNCNVISNHLANNPDTVGILDESCFEAMGKHAVFINTGRGAQVVTDALIKALRECPGRLALLDVTDPCEPPEEDSELYSLDNVILTPHIAGSIGYETKRMAAYMIKEYDAFVNGNAPMCEITREMLEKMT